MPKTDTAAAAEGQSNLCLSPLEESENESFYAAIKEKYNKTKAPNHVDAEEPTEPNDDVVMLPKDKEEVPKELQKDLEKDFFAYILNHCDIKKALNHREPLKPVQAGLKGEKSTG